MHLVKKIYKDGSPGAKRKRSGITLSQIKKNIRSGEVLRQIYQKDGQLGPIPATA